MDIVPTIISKNQVTSIKFIKKPSVIWIFLQAVFLHFKTEMSFKLSGRKFANLQIILLKLHLATLARY